MTFPVQGAWGRRSVSIDGGERFETQLAVWLQAGPCYADLRVPLHPAATERCFTGRSGWDGEGYCWAHQLDLEGPDAPSAGDRGALAWKEGAAHRVMIERGMFPTADGAAVRYEEVWARLPGDNGPVVALDGPDACLVRVGDHAITVVDDRTAGGGFAACYRVLGPLGWQVRAVIGAGASLPAPCDVPARWRVVHTSDEAPVRA